MKYISKYRIKNALTVVLLIIGITLVGFGLNIHTHDKTSFILLQIIPTMFGIYNIIY